MNTTFLQSGGEKKMRGFVTIATGDEKYYRLAVQLLHSCRNHGNSQIPFAIICDRENEFTEEFDDVIFMENPQKSFMDKLLLYKYSPYDETIFIDADSLFFNSPERLWEEFENEDDVSCYGVSLPLDSKKAWFSYEGTGKYKKDIEFLVDLHGGIYYFRKTDRAKHIFELAISLAQEYKAYDFKNFDKPADEPVLAMAMAIMKCHPMGRKPVGGVLFVPSYRHRVKINIQGDLLVDGNKRTETLCHFSTPNTQLFLYQYAVYYRECDYFQRKKYPLVNYWKYKVLTMPKVCKAEMRHMAGKIARKIMSEDMVRILKRRTTSG